jgi:hypothetical protein
MFSSRVRLAAASVVATVGLSACTVYDTAPAYPSYGYAPGYYYSPPPSLAFNFGYSSGGHGHRHHHHRRHHHWR